MGKDEAIKQLDAMESEAKKLIDAGQEKSSFMFDIADAATKMAVQNLELADFIIAGHRQGLSISLSINQIRNQEDV